MIVNVINEQVALNISIEQAERLIREVVAFEGQTCDEVSVYFVDTPTICRLHEQFFNNPSSTDCISFPMDEEQTDEYYRILGEVFVCPATAIEYGNIHKENPYKETSLYIVHGLLHLMGYDDLEDQDILEIRQAEDRHISHLQSLGLLLHLEIQDHS